MEYRRAWTNVLDLIQDGNVGLLEAVQRYDPYQGVKLSTYAVYWIRAYILQYILDNFRIVRLGTTRAQRKLFWRLNKEKRELERQGFEVEPRLIAERLDVSEAEVEDMDMRLRESDLSMNMPARRDEAGGAEFGDFVRASGASARRTSPTRSSSGSFSRRCTSSPRRSTSATGSWSTAASSPTSRHARRARRGVRRVARARAPARGPHRRTPARVPEGEPGRLRVLRAAER
jgi:RNA polymerase sigma factor (sigma-70 family)